jgi:hypothetical protein
MTANEAACSAHQGSFHIYISKKGIMKTNQISQPGSPSNASFREREDFNGSVLSQPQYPGLSKPGQP